MAYYSRHIFVCCNRREEGACCGAHGGETRVKFLRRLLKARGLHGAGKMRVNKAGCFDRCEEGPVLVVYPEGIWYQYKNDGDLEEIVSQHLEGGAPVPRLMLPAKPPLSATRRDKGGG